jgi:signal transduction histidine kinase
VDEGIGIPRQVYHKIFGIFVRAVTSERYEGTGIGLAIVARAMQRQGGTCGVESELGKGSRFWIELPAA